MTVQLKILADAEMLAGAAPGDAMIVRALLAELGEHPPHEASGVLQALGERLALMHPLGEADAPGEIAARMNLLWTKMAWGSAQLTVERDCILIDHRGWPSRRSGGDDGGWAPAALLIIEGVYHGWFRELGGGDALAVSLVSRKQDRLQLRYGG